MGQGTENHGLGQEADAPRGRGRTHLVLAELAQQRAGEEVAALHGQGQGPAVRRAQQRSDGLQQAHRHPRHLGAPPASQRQLLAQGLLQRQGGGAGAGTRPPRARAQWEDLRQRRVAVGGAGPSASLRLVTHTTNVQAL